MTSIYIAPLLGRSTAKEMIRELNTIYGEKLRGGVAAFGTDHPFDGILADFETDRDKGQVIRHHPHSSTMDEQVLTLMEQRNLVFGETHQLKRLEHDLESRGYEVKTLYYAPGYV